MPRPENPNAPLCPHCGNRMRSSGSRWRCEMSHGVTPGPKPEGERALTPAEKMRRYRERKRQVDPST